MEINIRNHEHYVDSTAYYALKNLEKEGKNMSRKGEIWTAEFNDGEKNVIILADHGTVLSVLSCIDEIKGNCMYPVNCYGGIKYTDPRMVSYLYNNRVNRYVRKMTDEEYNGIMRAVAENLGVAVVEKIVKDKTLDENKKTATDENNSLIEEMKKTLAEREGELKENEEYLRETETEVARLEAQLSVYRNLYSEVMQKLIGSVSV